MTESLLHKSRNQISNHKHGIHSMEASRILSSPVSPEIVHIVGVDPVVVCCHTMGPT